MEVGSKRSRARARWAKLRKWVRTGNVPRQNMSYQAFRDLNPVNIRYSRRYTRNRQLAQYRQWYRNTRRSRYKYYVKRQHKGFYK